MPIEKVTSGQFRDAIRNAIVRRTSTHDVGFGPIRDIVIDPMATVLERQNDRIRQVSLLVSLINSTAYTDADLDALVFNEGLVRSLGSQAVGTVTFRTAVAPGTDLVVPRGFPLGTPPDPTTGEPVTFVTTEARTLSAASAASYFNLSTNKYELRVPVVAVSSGSGGLVAAGRINALLRPLTGFSEVTNAAATTGGRDAETNAELIERYLLAVMGRDLVTPIGVERFARDEFSDVEDVLAVYGTDPLLTRAADDAGAVDLYVVGQQLVTTTETQTYLGLNQVHTLTAVPLVSVVSVVSGVGTHVEGTDYEVVFDTGGHAGSVRGVDGIRWLDGGTPPGAAGTAVTVTYTTNQLIRTMQLTAEEDDNLVFGRDLLVKAGVRVDVYLDATLVVNVGPNAQIVEDAVVGRLLAFINALELGDAVEASDLQGEVRRVSGVDNFLITRLVRDAAFTGASDIALAKNEYARIDLANLNVTTV